jgi:hypothetical protein
MSRAGRFRRTLVLVFAAAVSAAQEAAPGGPVFDPGAVRALLDAFGAPPADALRRARFGLLTDDDVRDDAEFGDADAARSVGAFLVEDVPGARRVWCDDLVPRTVVVGIDVGSGVDDRTKRRRFVPRDLRAEVRRRVDALRGGPVIHNPSPTMLLDARARSAALAALCFERGETSLARELAAAAVAAVDHPESLRSNAALLADRAAASTPHELLRQTLREYGGDVLGVGVADDGSTTAEVVRRLRSAAAATQGAAWSSRAAALADAYAAVARAVSDAPPPTDRLEAALRRLTEFGAPAGLDIGGISLLYGDAAAATLRTFWCAALASPDRAAAVLAAASADDASNRRTDDRRPTRAQVWNDRIGRWEGPLRFERVAALILEAPRWAEPPVRREVPVAQLPPWAARSLRECAERLTHFVAFEIVPLDAAVAALDDLPPASAEAAIASAFADGSARYGPVTEAATRFALRVGSPTARAFADRALAADIAGNDVAAARAFLSEGLPREAGRVAARALRRGSPERRLADDFRSAVFIGLAASDAEAIAAIAAALREGSAASRADAAETVATAIRRAWRASDGSAAATAAAWAPVVVELRALHAVPEAKAAAETALARLVRRGVAGR